MARQVIGEAESRKPIQDCRDLSWEFHGLNSGNIAQIQHIHCPSCRDCWICHVNKKGKRRGPEPPPGLNPREPMEVVYDVGRDMGTLFKLATVTQARLRVRTLRPSEEWRRGLFLRHLLADALTLPTQDSTDFVPTLSTMMTQGPQRMNL